MPNAVNKFNEGMNRDTAVSLFSNGAYYDLQNMKVVTEDGLSSGSIETERGNRKLFTIPSVPSSYKIESIPSGGDNDTTIEIGSQTETGVSFSDIGELASKIKDLFSSKIDSGDISVIIESEVIYIIGLDINEFYKGNGSDLSVDVEYSNGNKGHSIYYDSQQDLEICGWGTLRDRIILFSTNSTEQEPSGTYGQIWNITYDPVSEEIKNIDSDSYLVPSKHLVVNNQSNLSRYNRVGEVIGRYENVNIGRVYFTDDFNPLRSINIFDPNSYIVTANSMDIRADVDLSKPLIDTIEDGDLPVGSVVQYTYRQRNSAEGSLTVFAPLSNPIKLTEYDPQSDSFQNYGGSSKGTGEKRSVTYTIPFIDDRFDVIEHFLVIYENKDTPRIWKFEEENISGSGEIQVVNSEVPLDAVEITLSEFNKINSSFSRTKSIAVKDNRLIAANNKTKDLSIDFDGRAYRFNNSAVARLFSEDNLDPFSPEHTIDGSNPDWNIPKDADAVNLYNHDEFIWDYNASLIHDFNENYDYKYQTDGNTIGGEGKNISYRFITTELAGDQKNDKSTPPLIEPGRTEEPGNTDTYSDGSTDREGNQIFHDLTGEFASLKSPKVESLLTGYTRGEVYRFGIVFYDKEMNPFFVNWIGDIRFPFSHESIDGGSNSIGYNESNDDKIQKTLGVEFTVDISSVKDKISGFSIVRLPREKRDMTRIESGLIHPMYYIDPENADSSFKEELKNQLGTNNVNFQAYALDSIGAEYGITDRSGVWQNMCAYSGSIGGFDEFSDIVGDIDYIDYIAEVSNVSASDDAGIHVNEYTADTPNSFTRLTRIKNPDTSHSDVRGVESGNRIDIIGQEVFERGGSRLHVGGSNPHVLNDIWLHAMKGDNTWLHPIIGSEEKINKGAADGVGDRKLIIRTAIDPKNYWNLSDATVCYVTLGRKRDKSFRQYGGDSYEARSNNRYISTGHFQPVEDDLPDKYTFKVYGGDTYSYYYDSQITYRNIDKDNSDTDKSTNPKYTLALSHSIETPLNTELRDKSDSVFNNFARQGFASGNYSSQISTNFSFNDVYLQKNNSRRIFRSEDVFSNTVEEHSHQIWASDPKIDGELVDSWRFFKPASNMEVEGIYGPINKVINFKDIIYFLQDRALGATSINERSTVVSEQGTELTLGFGGILDDYRYISNITGTVHKFSVVEGENALYYFDALNRKFMRFGNNGNVPLSDVKGLFSVFNKEIDGRLETTDKSLSTPVTKDGNTWDDRSIGIHGVYDSKYNRVFMTFNKVGFDTSNIVPVLLDRSFTVAYSEHLRAFTGFYSMTPRIYLRLDSKIYSADPSDLSDIYIHDSGNYGHYYGEDHRSLVDIIVNEQFSISKIFNNVQYYSLVTDNSDNEIWDDTFSRIRLYNNYQDSGEVPITIDSNAKRRFRKWRIALPRDNDPSSITHDGSKKDDARIRDTWTHLVLYRDNTDGNKIILEPVETYFKHKPL